MVAVVKTGHELACVAWLGKRGIDAFTPAGRHRSRRRFPKQGYDEVKTAAFPGYIFIGHHALAGGGYRQADGFLHLLVRPSGYPLVATRGEIDHIRQRQDNGEFDGAVPAMGRRFRVGEVVVVTGGPLRGAEGVVLDQGRVRLSLFGREVVAKVATVRGASV